MINQILSLSVVRTKKFIKFNKINFVSNNNKINVHYLLFDNNFYLKDLGNVNIYLSEKNELKIYKKNNIYNIVGSSLDLSKYLSQKEKKNLKILN